MRKSKSNAVLRGLAASALVLMVSATAWGQKVKITGTVIDNTNEPVIGASVLENGTKNGVATDLDGHRLCSKRSLICSTKWWLSVMALSSVRM